MSKPLLWALMTWLALWCAPVYADRFFEDDDAFFQKYLLQQKFGLDTSAPAIVLYETNSYDFTTATHKVRRIIKVLKKSGYDYANIVIPVPGMRYGSFWVTDVHGYTYNMEHGKMVKQVINDDNVTTEETKALKEKKINMPAVREGSIIDCRYETHGHELHFIKWEVQDEIPKMYTKVEIKYPRELTFAINDPLLPAFFTIDENKKKVVDSLLPYAYTYDDNLPDGVLSQSWVRRNIKAFEGEPYISDESNYCEAMWIYLNSIHWGIEWKNLYSWDKVNRQLLEEYFDKPLFTSEQLVKDKAHELAGEDTNKLAVAKKIFSYVRGTISTEGDHGLWNNKALSKIMKDRVATATGKNMLLIAMLRYAGLTCSPVILATKDNGIPSTTKPDIYKYNYAICQLRVNGQKYYLDAAEKYYPFGVLSPKCLNGYARIIDKKDSGSVIFNAAMATEKEMYSVMTTNNTVNDYTLDFKYYFGTQQGADLRDEWNDDTTEIKKYILSYFKDFPAEVKLKQYAVQHLDDPDAALYLSFKASFVWPSNTLYMAPYMVKFFNKNPFKNAERKYDIQLPYTENLTYICKLQLPPGYEIEDVPKSEVVKIDDDVQYKNYITYDKENSQLNIDARLQVQKVDFDKADYGIVKDFFGKVMEAQQANVVIKKQL